MPYSVYYRGEITISPPLTEEHAAVVLAFSRKEYNDLHKTDLRKHRCQPRRGSPRVHGRVQYLGRQDHDPSR